MRLPAAARAIVEQRKIVDYLLSATHPDGATKAALFGSFGFRDADWTTFASALKRHGQINPVTNVVESRWGARYTVDGPMETPDGRTPVIRTVWVLEKGQASPRLVTAYPVGGRG